MKIKSMFIQNFKTFAKEKNSFSMNNLTALIGENSVGKSNILEALDVFFNYSANKVSINSFHHNNYLEPIVIGLVFHGLNDSEVKTFKSHLDANSELAITQYIIAQPRDEEKKLTEVPVEDIEFIENKHGTRKKTTEEYDWASLEDKAPTKTNIKNWWKKPLLVGDFDFKSLFDNQSEPTPEVYQDKLKYLWKSHADIIPQEIVTGDDKILGWKNKLKANLPKYFYIPAVKNISDDLKITKTSALGELIGWLTNSVSKEVKEEFKAKSNVLVSELLAKIDIDSEGKSKIGQINRALNDNIGFDIGCSLEIKFGVPEIQDLVFPQPKIFANDGYDSELTEKGHGVQRLALFSLLRTYNTFNFGNIPIQRNFILGIEEPEIYLHPPLKRSVYTLLRNISASSDQVVYTTHDSLFLSVEYFDEIRMFRKSNEPTPITTIYEFPIASMIAYFKTIGVDVEEKSIRHRFNHIIDETKNEGFFAKKIVLIEGETEKYALPVYFKARNFDIDHKRVTLINAGSVDNISFLLLLFNEFHIPCYVIFDGDRPKDDIEKLVGDKLADAKGKSKRNIEILSLVGEQVSKENLFFPPSTIADRYSVWEYDFENEFHYGLPKYDELKSEAKRLYGSHSKPLTAKYISNKIAETPENINQNIATIIEKIEALEWRKSITQ